MNIPMAASGQIRESSVSSWNASLSLTVSRTPRGSVLKRKSHQGPLYIQKPFYPEGRELAHLYVLHPPGGMVSGDTLAISVDVGEQASALVTTPGAGRVYKARDDKALQRQVLEFHVAPDASLEWLPLEAIIYPGALTQLDTHVHLQGNGRYMGWEVTSLGLPASGEAFTADTRMSQTLNIHRDDRLALREKLVVDGVDGMLAASAGLRQRPISGMMVAGPFDQSLDEETLNRLRQLCDYQIERDSQALAGVTLNQEFLIVRALGSCSEQTRKLFIDCWQLLRPLMLEREACPPRIWAT